MSIAGRAPVLLLLLALSVCGIALLAWISRMEPRISAPAAGEGPAAVAREAPRERLEPHEPLATGPEDPSRATDPQSAIEASESRFDGRGVIRGEVMLRGGAALPERWSLFVEPHPWLEGRERAASRRLDFEHGERKFRVEDLPLGGYLVRAQASTLNHVPASVLLVRGSADQFVTLLLLPSGFIDGGVLDAAGRPAEGLDVTIESTDSRQRATVSTDAAGNFLFRDVLDGEYRILFGRPDSPLLGPDSIAFKAPSLRFPTRTLPPTGSMKITVIDESLRPVARAHLSGSATGGSAIDAFGDHLGLVQARYLLPGHYAIDAVSEEGLEGHAAIELAAGREAEVEMIVRAAQAHR
jgi:hypothetical protein